MDYLAFRRWRQGVLDVVGGDGDNDPDDEWRLEEDDAPVLGAPPLPHRRVYGVRRDVLQDYTDTGFLQSFG